MALIDDGARAGTSSKGGHGTSPLRPKASANEGGNGHDQVPSRSHAGPTRRPNRREFITAGMSMALATMLPHTAHGALSGSKMKPVTIPRRKLGALEVSATAWLNEHEWRPRQPTQGQARDDPGNPCGRG